MSNCLLSIEVLLVSILSDYTSGDKSWMVWSEDPARDNIVPVSGGYIGDFTAKNVIDCARTCKQSKNCMGYVYVADTFTCQLHSQVWSTENDTVTQPTSLFYKLNDYINNYGGSNGCRLGLSDELVEGDWRISASNETPVYFNWNPGEPNGGTTGNCAMISMIYDSNWTDDSCNIPYFSICEKKVTL